MTELCGSPSSLLHESTINDEAEPPAFCAFAEKTNAKTHSNGSANRSVLKFFRINEPPQDTGNMRAGKLFFRNHLPRARQRLVFLCPTRTGRNGGRWR